MFEMFIKSCLDLIYPPLCLHCNETLYTENQLLCTHCFDLLELIDIKLHCPACFTLKPAIKKHFCLTCATKKSSLTSLGAAFEYKGAAATLIKGFKYGNKPYLAGGLAGFMAAQFIELNWPLPDLIIPVPQSLSRRLTRGYNQAELLASNLSILLQRPVLKALSRKSDDYSQAGLSISQRMQLNGKTIFLKKNHLLQDKIILLIDDVLTTGTTLKKCAEALLEGYPKSIYALTFCQANQKR